MVLKILFAIGSYFLEKFGIFVLNELEIELKKFIRKRNKIHIRAKNVVDFVSRHKDSQDALDVVTITEDKHVREVAEQMLLNDN